MDDKKKDILERVEALAVEETKGYGTVLFKFTLHDKKITKVEKLEHTITIA